MGGRSLSAYNFSLEFAAEAEMKSLLLLLLGIAIGALMGWYLRALADRGVRAGGGFTFNDKLSDPQASYLSAKGTWRGADLANKINTVEIFCTHSEMTCDMSQADVISLTGRPFLSLYSKSFRITKLDDRSVMAEPSLPDLCIRQTLLFDRAAKAVTFARTKINHEEVCSMVQNEPVTLFLGEPLP
jgi:hypothetical protein